MSWYFFLQSTIEYNSRKSTNHHNYKDWKLHRPLITLIKQYTSISLAIMIHNIGKREQTIDSRSSEEGVKLLL